MEHGKLKLSDSKDESADLWTAFLKKDVKTPPLAVKRDNYVLTNTRLVDQYSTKTTTTVAECFDQCDSDERCGAACFTLPTQCRLSQIGFAQVTSVGSTAYIKPDVSDEMANMDTLGIEFPVVKQRTRLSNHYGNVYKLKPSLCFADCQESEKCGAATFTFYDQWSLNCFYFEAEKYGEGSDDKWISYFKKEL
jgi:hypothetical protein